MKKPKKEKPVSECLKELNAHTQQSDDIIHTELDNLWELYNLCGELQNGIFVVAHCLEDAISENESLKDKIKTLKKLYGD